MNVLCLSRYSLQAANTRYRVGQYVDKLRCQCPDVSIDYVPAYSDAHLFELYRNGRPTLWVGATMLGAMLKRFIDLTLRDFDRYDAIIATADLIPWLPFVMESRAYRSKPGVVIDLDDARWTTYSRMPVLRHKYSRVLASARHVIAGNHQIARHALQYNTHVTVIPTVVDADNYRPKEHYEFNDDGRANIGWIGTPVTAQHLLSHSTALRSLALRRKFVLNCIGAGAGFQIPGVDVCSTPWSAKTESEVLRSLDIGIMPLPDDAIARGKSGLKLIQYLAAGLPAVASAVGANCDIIVDNVSGLLSHSIDEFAIKLEMLLADRDLRISLGTAGRKVAVERFSLQSQSEKFASVLMGS